MARPSISRMGRPASTTTMTPDAAISSDVPRSGWRAIRTVGTIMIVAKTTRSRKDGGMCRSCRYQAAIIGTASFMISDGWKRMPMSSQRRAPWPISPMTSTRTSSTMPASRRTIQLSRGGFCSTSTRDLCEIGEDAIHGLVRADDDTGRHAALAGGTKG